MVVSREVAQVLANAQVIVRFSLTIRERCPGNGRIRPAGIDQTLRRYSVEPTPQRHVSDLEI
jgi:hypothetical protein